MKTFQDAKKTAWNITKSFEGTNYSGLTGSFDGQGFTHGVLGWNLGQGTLQNLIKAYQQADPGLFRKCCTVFVPVYNKTMDLSDLLLKVAEMNPIAAVKWSLERQSNNQPQKQWNTVFYNLGQEVTFQAIQKKFAEPKFIKALKYCHKYKLYTERAFCLFFDCIVQQGSIKLITHTRIINTGFNKANYENKLIILSKAMANQARPQYQTDVLMRRLCIAKGKGKVHRRNYNLDKEFDLTDSLIIIPTKKTPILKSLLTKLHK